MKKLLLVLLCLYANLAIAQTSPLDDYPLIYFGPAIQTIVVDPDLNVATSPVPFDRFFYLRVYTKDGGPGIIQFAYQEFRDANGVRKREKVTLHNLFSRKVILAAGSTDLKAGYTLYEILMPPLNPKRTCRVTGYYTMTDDQLTQLADAAFELYKDGLTGNTAHASSDAILKKLNADKKAIQDYYSIDPGQFGIYYTSKISPRITVAGIVNDAERKTIINNILHADYNLDLAAPTGQTYANGKSVQTVPFLMNLIAVDNLSFTPFSMDTRTSNVLTVDAGYVAYGFQNGIFGGTPYVGVDYYLRPFDPAIPMSYVNKYNHLSILDRLSFNLGITLNSVAKPLYRADLFNTKNNVIIGAGYRLNNLFKINFGALAYYKLDPDFLINHKTINFTPYVGLSLDIRIPSVFGNFSKLFSL